MCVKSMRLEVHKNGVKLFFITFAVMGRRPILSRLVDEKKRPELLPLGEWVKQCLLAIHQVWGAVGISDFVIMPDHVHFLLVVDYLRAAQFNPLWATHRLMDAIETGWNARGQAPEPPNAVTELAAAVARGRAAAASLQAGFGAASPEVPIIFERNPWLDLAFDPRQLKAIRHYIRLH